MNTTPEHTPEELRQFKWKRFATLQDHNMKLLEENQQLKQEIIEHKKSTHLLHEAMVSAEKLGHDKAIESQAPDLLAKVSEQEKELSQLKEERKEYRELLKQIESDARRNYRPRLSEKIKSLLNNFEAPIENSNQK